MGESGEAVIMGASSWRFDPYYRKGDGWSEDGYSGWGMGSAVCKVRYNGEKHSDLKGTLLGIVHTSDYTGNVCRELDKGNYITSCSIVLIRKPLACRCDMIYHG